MNTIKQVVRVKLALAGVSLAEVARSKRLDYSRLHRVIGGYAAPRSGEIEELLRAIEESGTGGMKSGFQSPRRETARTMDRSCGGPEGPHR
ncbi:MAG: hypothetical protein LAO51_10520 [Acidobacteriia bacterium]|nr:hypothetical protein [Terriglobia bacterium]